MEAEVIFLASQLNQEEAVTLKPLVVRRHFWLQSWILCACLLFTSAAALALDPGRRLNQLAHRTWTVREGAPGQITSLAQTTDGFLWIGTTHGLFRFDGIRFEPFTPVSGDSLQSTDIYCLLATPDGSLWVGFHYGGVSRIEHRHVTNYGERQGFPPGRVAKLARDPDGGIWAAAASGLARFDGSHWEVMSANRGFDGSQFTSVFVDARGTVWAADSRTIMYLPHGQTRFLSTGEKVDQVPQIGAAPDGSVWLSDVVPNSIRPIRVSEKSMLWPGPQIKLGTLGFLFDRQGSFWCTTGDGVFRLPHPELYRGKILREKDKALQKFSVPDGLTAKFTWPMLEDREGTIWVGTSKGLDQFRDTSILPFAFPADYLQFGMVPDAGGVIWTTNLGRKITRIHPDTNSIDSVNLMASSGYRDSRGVLWFEDKTALWFLRNGQPVRIPWPKQVSLPQMYALPITEDKSGSIWVGIEGYGLFDWNGASWTHFPASTSIQKLVPLIAFTDSRNRIWFGYGGGVVSVIDATRFSIYSESDGLKIGSVKAITGGGDDVVWLGGEQGLAYYRNGKFHQIATDGNALLTGISGIVRTADGSLWLSENRGIAHIIPAEVNHALSQPNYAVHYELFDNRDAVPGVIQQARPFPTAIQGTDGRLWFATTGGAASIDPMHMYRNQVPPLISIESVLVDGKVYPAEKKLRLPRLTQNLEIDYTALSLAIPERVRFQYLLEGADAAWQDVGTRREAFYTRLSPREYRFRVRACNNDGVWGEAASPLTILIPPAFYQTLWFRIVCMLAVAALIFLIYLSRLRRIATIYQGRFEERLNERTRIARELHDTLLQSVQGLVLRFHAVARQIPSEHPARRTLEAALDRADEVIAEGRDRVRDLRDVAGSISDLPAAFRRVAEESSPDGDCSFQVVVVGTLRDLHPLVLEESHAVGREALLNAFVHSEGSKFEVEIIYDSKEFLLRVRDDGKGIDGEILQLGGREGHWGLQGMRERARRIGAQLALWSRPGTGTEVELKVPAATAYLFPGKRFTLFPGWERNTGKRGKGAQ